MERQLLIKTFIILFALNACQQIQVNDIDISNIDDKKIEKNDVYEEIDIPYLNIWQYLITNSLSKEEVINEQILFYMNSHIKDIEKFSEYLNDSYYFIYFVINELEKAELPLELALLPYIESNYDPFSISSSGPVGIWQFMPRTGRLYELERTWLE
jgi:Transglycosylase SLT domain.